MRITVIGLGKIGLEYDYNKKNFFLTHSKALFYHKNFDLLCGVDKNIKQLLPEVNQNLLPEVNQNLLPEMNQTIEDNKFFCKSNADNTVNLDRLSYYPNDPYYQKINNKKYNYINYY